jgi:hypothetical protein
MAKVRKRHNPNKRAQRFFASTVIWTWEADRDPATDTQYATAKARTARGWELLAPKIVNAIVQYRNNWIITVRAFCRDATGLNGWRKKPGLYAMWRWVISTACIKTCEPRC